jgi:fumarate reductase flavoprotein subunit
MTGTVLEEGLRGAGGWLLDGAGERFMAAYDPRGERATRDIVSRAIDDVIRTGRATPLGGVYLQMKHLGPELVRKQFKGMVERCADCGFDLAGGRVEVVPTAHYMMGGVVFGPDCRTALDGVFAAGEDTGGVHGANRLGGNGVANSTVFGGIAGSAMAGFVRDGGVLREIDRGFVDARIAALQAPLARPPGDIEDVRDALQALMWDEVGIVRDAAGLERALDGLAALDARLDAMGVGGGPAFNLTWHDWMNLKNLVLTSRVIAVAARERGDSRGAHFRRDNPQVGDLASSSYTVVRQQGSDLSAGSAPVRFTRVRPGETLLKNEAAEGIGDDGGSALRPRRDGDGGRGAGLVGGGAGALLERHHRLHVPSLRLQVG